MGTLGNMGKVSCGDPDITLAVSLGSGFSPTTDAGPDVAEMSFRPSAATAYVPHLLIIGFFSNLSSRQWSLAALM